MGLYWKPWGRCKVKEKSAQGSFGADSARARLQCATVFNGPFGRLMNHTTPMHPSIRSVASA
jgi:hypothetical protein